MTSLLLLLLPDAWTHPLQLASRLKVTRYPYIGLLAFGGSRTRLVAALQGTAGAEEVLQVLVRAVEEQGPLLVAERAEQQERVRRYVPHLSNCVVLPLCGQQSALAMAGQ
jgi:hypothetical protein